MSKNKNEKKPTNTPVKTTLVFNRDNYKWMIIGVIVIIIVYLLMIGKTDDLFVGRGLFEEGISFSSHIKITLAPLLVLIGFGIEVYAIMKRPAASADNEAN
jgi:K+-transporting ATPase A subunit